MITYPIGTLVYNNIRGLGIIIEIGGTLIYDQPYRIHYFEAGTRYRYSASTISEMINYYNRKILE